MVGGNCFCMCSSVCGPPNGGRDCSIPGNACVWLEVLPQSRAGLPADTELQQAPQAAKAPYRRESHSTMEGKWGRVFFRDQLDTAWSFLIRETNYFCCTEKTRGGLHGFLVSYNGVARLPSVLCSAVIFYTILLKSRALSPIFVIFFPQIFLVVQFSKHSVVLQLCFVNPKQTRGISSHLAGSSSLYSLQFHVWLIHSSLWLNPASDPF